MWIQIWNSSLGLRSWYFLVVSFTQRMNAWSIVARKYQSSANLMWPTWLWPSKKRSFCFSMQIRPTLKTTSYVFKFKWSQLRDSLENVGLADILYSKGRMLQSKELCWCSTISLWTKSSRSSYRLFLRSKRERGSKRIWWKMFFLRAASF